MRFVNEQYYDLVEGHRLAKQLDAKFWEHKVYVSWKERQANQRRKKLKTAGIAVAVSWMTLGCVLVVFTIFDSGKAILNSLFFLLLLFAAVLCSTGYAIVILSDKEKKMQKRWSIYHQWLKMIFVGRLPSQRQLNDQFLRTGNQNIDQYTRYGAQGVLQTLRHLNPGRDGKWFVLTNVMFSKSEDADIVLVGPAGIWVLESKYWSGHINIEKGKWSRVKVYYVSGGRRKSEHEWIDKHWDDQWLRQKNGIIRALNGSQTTSKGHYYKDLIYGGIVLSHPKARLNADGTQKATIGNLSHWNFAIPKNAANSVLRVEDCLGVVDKLLSASRSHQKSPIPCVSAIDLARQIGKDVLTEANQSNRSRKRT